LIGTFSFELLGVAVAERRIEDALPSTRLQSFLTAG
jgi:hypothetical protein